MWFDADGNQKKFDDIILAIDKVSDKIDQIYVGSDSMVYTNHIIFVTAICLHSNENKIGNYFFDRNKVKRKKSSLKLRIFKEIEDSVSVAQKLRVLYPNHSIEIHADVNSKENTATHKFTKAIEGWMMGCGFNCAFKPKSWASSAVADWHTKKIK